MTDTRLNVVRLDEEHHIYWCGEIQLDSITSFFKEIGLEKGDYPIWYTERGSEIHRTIKLMNDGYQIEMVDPQIEPFVESYKKAKEELGFKTLHSEIITSDLGLRIAGSIDEIAEFPESAEISAGKYIIDYKSGQKKRLWELQTAGYHICWLREHGESLKRLVLQLKEDHYKVYLHEDDHDMLVFTGIMSLVRWRNAKRRCNPLVLPILEESHTE